MSFFRATQSERGFSLYETLIALALVTIGVIMVSQIAEIIPDRKISLKRACDSHAQRIAVAVQEETYYREILNFFPTGTASSARTATDVNSAFTFASTRALPNTPDAWAPVTDSAFLISDISGTSSLGSDLRSAQLIQGSIRTLAAIYNNNPSVRCIMGTYPPLTDIPPSVGALAVASEFLLRVPTVQIQIRPVNIADGSNAACSSYVHIGPQGDYEQNGMYNAFAPGSARNMPDPVAYYEEWVDPAPYSPFAPGVPGANLPELLPLGAQFANSTPITQSEGFALDVRVNYNDEHGAPTEQCEFTQRFQYPRDRVAPPPPNIIEVVAGSNLTTPPASVYCVPNVASGATVLIGYDPSKDPLAREFERGSQFLCRDLSWKKGFAPDPGPNVFNTTQCIMYGVRSGSVMVRPSWPYYDPQNQDFSQRVDQWVPCDQLKQCNVSPSVVSFTPAPNTLPRPPGPPYVNNTGALQQYTLTYGTLPQGCVLNFEVVAVDTAGNTSVANVVNNRAFLENPTPGITLENEIHYSDCGTFVPGPVVVGPNTYNQGYFFCP